MTTSLLKRLAVTFLTGITTVSFASFAEDDAPLDLRASIVYSSYSGSGMRYEGMYRVPVDGSDNFTELKRQVIADGGGVAVNGKYYAVHQYGFPYSITTSNMVVYDEATWDIIEPKTNIDPKFVATDVSLDPVTGEVYGCFYKTGTFSDGFVLAKMNYEDMVRTDIADLGSTYLLGVAIDRNGQMYAIDAYDRVFKVDKATGEKEQIGLISSYPSEYQGSACFDVEKGDLYYSVFNYNMISFLLKIDVNNFKYELVKQFRDQPQMVSMYIPFNLTEDGAPAAISDFNATFTEKSLEGIASFTLPVLTFDGSSLSGSLTWHLLADGEEIKTGSANAGEKVDVDITLSAGKHQLSVFTTNSAGDSPRSNISVFAGAGTPKAPTNPSFSVDATNGHVSITWEAVTESANGGYVDPAAITYNVYRNPGKEIVATGVSALQTEDVIDDPALKLYSYEICAVYDGNESASAETEKFTMGSILPPYEVDFKDKEMNALWTIINVNDDNSKWTFSTYGGKAECRYNSVLDMDDWLITPPVLLEGGNCYQLSLSADGNPAFPEKLEIKMGDSPTVEGMTIGITDVITLTENATKISEYLYPETSGIYYIGFHGCSDADMSTLRIYDIKLGESISMSTPQPVSELKVIPDALGDAKATVEFKLPEKLSDGGEIGEMNALTEVTVYCDDEISVNITENLVAGELMECELSDLTYGEHTFSVSVSNQFGAGKAESIKAFIGINTPSSPENVVIAETEKTGVIRVDWDKVTKDVDGYDLNSDLVEYDIYSMVNSRYVPVLTNVKDNSAEVEILSNPDRQSVVDVAVMAHNSAGESGLTFSNSILVGNPYSMPYYDSFNDGEGRPVFAEDHASTDPLAGNNWYRYQDDPDGVMSPYRDGWLAAMKGRENEWARLYTGIIKIEGENPMLSFYTYNLFTDEPNRNSIMVQAREKNGEWNTLKTIEISSLGETEGWYKVMQSLKEFEGQEIQLGFVGTTVNYDAILLDNISVSVVAEKDMAIKMMTAPTHVRAGKDFSIDVYVENSGTVKASGATLNLMDGSETMHTETLADMEPGEMMTVTIPGNLSSKEADSHKFSASIVFDGDSDMSNNTSDLFETALLKSSTPTVIDLKAETNPSGIEINWSAPDVENAIGYETLDDFENYEAWANENVGDWTFIDKDYLPLIGFKNLNFPFGTSPQSWWVNDADWKYFTSGFSAHSGSKYIAQMSIVDDGYPADCDDFAISPRLDGSEQTVSFWVKRYSPMYKETFDFMVSSAEDPTRTVNFMVQKANISAPNDWTEMYFDVPEGTKYFAIRCTSYNALMMFVDDVMFKAATPEKLEITGYNIYRDGDLLTTVDSNVTSYTDADVEELTPYEYTVTTLYRKVGESLHSNAASAVSTSIDEVKSLANFGMRLENRTLYAYGCQGLTFTVADLSGTVYFNGTDRDEYSVEFTAPGVYIVRCGNVTRKLLVR